MAQSSAPAAPPSTLERFFKIRERGSSVGTEIRGGLTTFIVMAYILVVNPVILSVNTQGAGPDFVATATMTALAAGVLTLLMGLWANYPFALASGLGLNAFVAFDLILGRKMPWQAAMGVVFLEGIIITILVLTGFRSAVLAAFPTSIKRAIGVGIGVFILFIGLVNAGFVRVPVESIPIANGVATGQPATPVTLGNLSGYPVLLSVLGLALAALLTARRVRGALLIAIVATTVVAFVVHSVTGADISNAPGVQGGLPTSFPPPSFATFGAGVSGALQVFTVLPMLTALLVIFSIMLSDFFDTFGTMFGLAEQANLLDQRDNLPGSEQVLLVDGMGAAVGGALSASSVTMYIESGAGIAEGARTGLASVVTGMLFLLCIGLAPLTYVVPAEATAPALIIVGFYMTGVLREINFADFTEGFPALLAIAVMPLTFSITNGVGAAVVAYAFVKMVAGRGREVHWLLWLVAVAFLLYFALPALRGWVGA
ncbi:MAG: NCS2 family permease [Dehalococcoidia bacterium]